jgi:uncharacterized protein (TIGR02996 family)
MALHPEERAFLDAIIAAPDDDLPRLVFADWLQEHDQPERAEFIRVQCELARTPAGTPEATELKARSYALLRAHEKEWTPEALKPFFYESREHDNFCYWERGFPSKISIAENGFLQRWPVLRSVAPIEHIVFYLVHAHNTEKLVTSPLIRDVRSCYFYTNDMGDNGIETLANHSANFTSLRHLTLQGAERFGIMRQLAAVANFKALRSIDLPPSGNAEAFADAFRGVRMQQIERGQPVTYAALETINGRPISEYGIPAISQRQPDNDPPPRTGDGAPHEETPLPPANNGPISPSEYRVPAALADPLTVSESIPRHGLLA